MSSSDHQHRLFADLPPWAEKDARQHRVADVVFARGCRRPLTYLVPERLCESVHPGKRVLVPLGKGNRRTSGYCVDVRVDSLDAGTLKEVSAVLDREPLLSAPMLRLTHWMARYYLCDWGQVLEAAVPGGVRGEAGTRESRFLAIPATVRSRLHELRLPAKQRQVLDFIAAQSAPSRAADVVRSCDCSPGPVQALVKKGLLKSEIRRHRFTDHAEPAVRRTSPHPLNHDQKTALQAILDPLRAGRSETILIHGVTGSGKTEVYMWAIDEVLSYGRQAIVLVPEISLTPQTKERFRSRFEQVAVLHSHLSDAERHWHWERIAAGAIQVVVGVRSAVFAPVPRLGLIILDEEHEPSFKQETVPRYHTRTVAAARARECGIPLVLGSATPCLESWWGAKGEEGRLVAMPRRVLDRPLPAARTIDLRLPERVSSRGVISRPLHQAMDRALRQGGQIILLLNRRGFSTHIQCPRCGHVLKCPQCDIALTHHRQGETARCHYCDYSQPTPDLCPECRRPAIRFQGAGTQKLEAEVRARFPGRAVLRMDTDSMRGARSHAMALERFRRHEVDILVGTQMIAKGLDFPGVTLVGVVNADVGLHLPDFRAAERTFQLITQVAGRTGRGERGGQVLVQTYTPEHFAIQAAVRHDFDRFAASEIPLRRQFLFPPFAELMRIIVRGPSLKRVRAYADELAGAIRQELSTTTAPEGPILISGPAAAPVARLRGNHRCHMLLRGPSLSHLREILGNFRLLKQQPEDVDWQIDVDPQSML